MAFPEVLGLADLVKIVFPWHAHDEQHVGATGILVSIDEHPEGIITCYTVHLPQLDRDIRCEEVQLIAKANPPTHHGTLN